MLPMQRITRLPLLVDAIYNRLNSTSPEYQSCKDALQTLNKVPYIRIFTDLYFTQIIINDFRLF